MRNKLTIILFGLLLAVGWTNVAQAQLKIIGPTEPVTFKSVGPVTSTSVLNYSRDNSVEAVPNLNTVSKVKSGNSKLNAPRRASYTVVADAVHPKSWYEDLGYYAWFKGEETTARYAKLTDPATDPYQIWYLLRDIYMSPQLPGIKYSEPLAKDHEYKACDFGWYVSGDITENITIDMTANMNISYIGIYDYAGTRLAYYDAANYINTMPSTWTRSSYIERTTSNGVSYLKWRSGYAPSGYNLSTAITIPMSDFTGKGGLQVLVKARRTTANPSGFNKAGGTTYNHYCYAVNFSQDGEEITMNRTNEWQENVIIVSGPVTPPTENGYTVAIVKLKDKDENDNVINNDVNVRAPEYTESFDELINYLDTYVDEVELLTDGIRVGQDDGNGGLIDGGTMFSYTGTLNRFFFISKGKMAYIAGTQNYWYWGRNAETGLYTYNRESGDRAPFYNMYEEFSPTAQDNVVGIGDFYADMVNGESYHIKHDCNSVSYMQHYFAMNGKAGTDPKSVSSLVFFIPDDRGQQESDFTSNEWGTEWRNYNPDYQPRVGLYTIRLNAEATPSTVNDGYYTITVTWNSSLSGIVDNQVPETFDLYEVIYDENGNIVEYNFIGTFSDQFIYTTEVEQTETSFTRYYQVKGHPTKATNPDYFYTWSNIDDVTIPGTFDFLKLEKDHVESDFVIEQQKNWYRNYLYPTNLAPNTGMTMEQLKQEWPDDLTAKYTLYRDSQGVAQLEVRAVGKKLYYRIKYYKATQEPNNLPDVQYINQNK